MARRQAFNDELDLMYNGPFPVRAELPPHYHMHDGRATLVLIRPPVQWVPRLGDRERPIQRPVQRPPLVLEPPRRPHTPYIPVYDLPDQAALVPEARYRDPAVQGIMLAMDDRVGREIPVFDGRTGRELALFDARTGREISLVESYDPERGVFFTKF
jgi:hypothetical protein